jgi:flagellar M-ring protein FliF
MDQFSKLGPVQAISKFWGTLTNTQRFISVLFISVSVVLLSVVSVVATKPRMEVLFSGLEQADAGAVVSKLQERGVKYELTDGGSVVRVPAKDVHEMRLALATEGLPAGGSVGFEIFDKTSFGMTEFAQKLNYQRGLQGELERTISTLDMVEQARVHVSIPEESVFNRDRQDKYASASVVVKLRPGGQLGSDQVGGIVHLVSAAVVGLKPGHVTVVDTQGNILSEAGDDATGLDPRLSASQLQLKSNEEERIEKDLQTMLDRVVGANKAVVRVNARMNFDRRETSSEVFNPGGTGAGLLVTESTTDETYGGGPGAPATAGVAKGEGYRRTERNNKYQVSRTTEHVIKSPGSIEQLSIAVMLDEKVDAARIPSVKKAVEAAVGADPKRGDRVTVESVPFDNSAMQKEAKELAAIASKANYMGIGKTVGAVLLLLGFLFFLKKTLGSVKISVTEQTVAQMPTQGKVAVAEGHGPPQADGGAVLQGVGDKRPEEVAQVIKSWISESS